jgi:hypothetical protein
VVMFRGSLVRICFVVPKASSIFDPSRQYAFGGAEVRAYLFSPDLALATRSALWSVTSGS